MMMVDRRPSLGRGVPSLGVADERRKRKPGAVFRRYGRTTDPAGSRAKKQNSAGTCVKSWHKIDTGPFCTRSGRAGL